MLLEAVLETTTLKELSELNHTDLELPVECSFIAGIEFLKRNDIMIPNITIVNTTAYVFCPDETTHEVYTHLSELYALSDKTNKPFITRMLGMQFMELADIRVFRMPDTFLYDLFQKETSDFIETIETITFKNDELSGAQQKLSFLLTMQHRFEKGFVADMNNDGYGDDWESPYLGTGTIIVDKLHPLTKLMVDKIGVVMLAEFVSQQTTNVNFKAKDIIRERPTKKLKVINLFTMKPIEDSIHISLGEGILITKTQITLCYDSNIHTFDKLEEFHNSFKDVKQKLVGYDNLPEQAKVIEEEYFMDCITRQDDEFCIWILKYLESVMSPKYDLKSEHLLNEIIKDFPDLDNSVVLREISTIRKVYADALENFNPLVGFTGIDEDYIFEVIKLDFMMPDIIGVELLDLISETIHDGESVSYFLLLLLKTLILTYIDNDVNLDGMKVTDEPAFVAYMISILDGSLLNTLMFGN